MEELPDKDDNTEKAANAGMTGAASAAAPVKPALPHRLPWPPIFMVGFLAIGLLLGWLEQGFTSPGFGPAFRVLGGVLIVFSILIDAWVFQIFQKHKTTIRPDRAADALVTSGPFRLSRNPIYVGNVLVLVGVGLLTGIWLFYAFSILNFILLDRIQIEREEAVMEETFGEDWDAYAAKVRRWI